MTYLAIMVIVAGLGISRLWILQRRQRSRTNTIDGFQKALGAISKPDGARRHARRARARHRPRSPRGDHSDLDPARREAARRRIAARRAASRHVADVRRAPRGRAAG